ncbi:hypothetical protein LI90_943 [Carbonactinospora thermoautotrophica]|uniref:Uncharacterized protein n=2 Tax=Carbonactinospora thermoautotrophica TaxID=1469144 RepID=A0A132MNL1_9ACTN|nr:hypothetical protein [Carbonactinospora thermoautotrophica]KWW99309.1 hypothetical protein LI90_943 [Carbonactinospora thermoautotrophica]
MSEMDIRSTEEALDGGSPEIARLDIETPEADAVEQHQDLREPRTGAAPLLRRIPFDVNEADVADQNRVVEFDEDDYR